MKRSVSALHSSYIIDGSQMDYTPAQMLDDCMPGKQQEVSADTVYDSIIDEIADPVLKKTAYNPDRIQEYTENILKTGKTAARDAAAFPKSFCKRRIADTLLSAIWKKGHFTLEDLRIQASWKWDCNPLGNMAAFYFSAEAAGQYLYDLGVRLSGYAITGSSAGNRICLDSLEIHRDTIFTAAAAEDPEPVLGESCQDEAEDYPEYTESEKDIPQKRKCPDSVLPDGKSWIIYIPFDTCQFKLGGSLLAEKFGSNGDNAPEIKDPDYFIDCFEVLRELVEDGVVISGTTVSDGGLACAAEHICRENGCTIDLKGIETAYMEKDIIRILFAEVPGVIIQIRDSDYDYVDAQLLLQDIAYYPLGHPDPSMKGIRISENGRPDVFSILEALLNNPSTSEGED